jgi:hypothetical protein
LWTSSLQACNGLTDGFSVRARVLRFHHYHFLLLLGSSNIGARCNVALAPLYSLLERASMRLQITQLLAVVLFVRINPNLRTCRRSVASLKRLSTVQMNTKRH